MVLTIGNFILSIPLILSKEKLVSGSFRAAGRMTTANPFTPLKWRESPIKRRLFDPKTASFTRLLTYTQKMCGSGRDGFKMRKTGSQEGDEF